MPPQERKFEMRKNLKFDRLESETEHHYNLNRGFEPLGIGTHEGYLKCKLIHSKGKSLIIPDLIFIMTDEKKFEWIQFYSFLPCLLSKFSEDEIIGSFSVDISFGNTIRLTISNEWHQYNLKDNSNIFKCRIQGPENIHDYMTGEGEIIDGIPFIYLYHHTLPEYRALILSSSVFRCSAWNYQGTKQLVNFAYCYFTSLPEIEKPNDLKMIAMASDGKIEMIVDLINEVISIDVYRESTSNRTATIKMLIDSSIIENNHIWEHESDNGIVYYEKSNAFIYRIGAEKGTILQIKNGQIERTSNIRLLQYIIVGDARSSSDIVAPFNEEETESIYKIEEFPDNNDNLLKFWFNNANTDLYTRKDIEFIEFEGRK